MTFFFKVCSVISMFPLDISVLPIHEMMVNTRVHKLLQEPPPTEHLWTHRETDEHGKSPELMFKTTLP